MEHEGYLCYPTLPPQSALGKVMMMVASLSRLGFLMVESVYSNLNIGLDVNAQILLDLGPV